MKNVQLVADNQVQTDLEPARTWREQPISEDWLFQSTDEAGRTGWFLRLSITGLYPRRVGPYRSKADAVDALEEVLYDIETQALCELHNSMGAHRVYVIEGVPTLTARQAERQPLAEMTRTSA